MKLDENIIPRNVDFKIEYIVSNDIVLILINIDWCKIYNLVDIFCWCFILVYIFILFVWEEEMEMVRNKMNKKIKLNENIFSRNVDFKIEYMVSNDIVLIVINIVWCKIYNLVDIFCICFIVVYLLFCLFGKKWLDE